MSKLLKRLGLPDVPSAADRLRARLWRGERETKAENLIDPDAFYKRFLEEYPHLDPKNKETSDDQKKLP